LGYKLFIRNYHQLILTPEAEQLIPIAKNILKEMSAATSYMYMQNEVLTNSI